jgi:hypothetical protein
MAHVGKISGAVTLGWTFDCIRSNCSVAVGYNRCSV